MALARILRRQDSHRRQRWCIFLTQFGRSAGGPGHAQESTRASFRRARPLVYSIYRRRRVRSPFFCGDLLHHFDFKVALGQELLQPRILLLHLVQALHFVGIHDAVALAPAVDQLLAYAVLLGYFRNGSFVGFARDRHHLLFLMTTFLQGSHPLKFQLVRKSPGRSIPSHHVHDKNFHRSTKRSKLSILTTKMISSKHS